MAAEAQRAPRVAREQTNLADAALVATGRAKPAIQRRKPVINDAFDALDDFSLGLIQLRALLATISLRLNHDVADHLPTGDFARSKVNEIDLLLDLAIEKIDDSYSCFLAIDDVVRPFTGGEAA